MEIDDSTLSDFALVEAWCTSKGDGWQLLDTAETTRSGGTATVYRVQSPDYKLAYKLYSVEFSEGARGAESLKRLEPQIKLGLHKCPYVVRVHDGGMFKDRLFVLMDAANGRELEECLDEIPRTNIRSIVNQIAKSVMFLREHNLCHRDIKSANIFISDDYEHAVLLDLSVLRDVDDPMGLGTDHGHELPVVATSRYSPPEYLFRLLPASPELWHALDVYQLGGLLHDLIMREPMFESDYQKTRETNRYRFAWIVATVNPIVEAADVDSDLVFLARRCLDKDWQRRSQIRLEEFLDNSRTRKANALAALGGQKATKEVAKISPFNTAILLNKVSKEVEESCTKSLRDQRITAIHTINDIENGYGRSLKFCWNQTDAAISNIEFAIDLVHEKNSDPEVLKISAKIAGSVEGQRKTAEISLPSRPFEERESIPIADDVNEALGTLAVKLMSSDL